MSAGLEIGLFFAGLLGGLYMSEHPEKVKKLVRKIRRR